MGERVKAYEGNRTEDFFFLMSTYMDESKSFNIEEQDIS